MPKRSRDNPVLVAMDIEGDWNRPLLENAAAMSESELVLGRISDCDRIRSTFDTLISCEISKRSKSVYDFPAPRGRVALIVGNELAGIEPKVLSQSDQIVSIPMYGRGMSSVNVAVAAAVSLYVMDRDLARRPNSSTTLRPHDVDLLIHTCHDPSEVGSLLRSVWAFGWRKVLLADQEGVWFCDDRHTVSQGRAAARREMNPLVIAPAEQINLGKYAHVLCCSTQRQGTPLSRLKLPDRGPLLVCFGEDSASLNIDVPVQITYVDHRDSRVEPRFRHAGSILLSNLSQMLRRGQRG